MPLSVQTQKLGGLLKWVGIFFATAAIALCVLHQKQRHHKLEHRVYVWQRNWTSEVTLAVSTLPDNISGILPLAAEIGFSKDDHKPVVQWVSTDNAALSLLSVSKEFVIRIGGSAAQTHWNEKACEAITDLCLALKERAAQSGLDLNGIQIDYDCPASRLGDYAKLLRVLRTHPELESFQLSFTALPSWLDTSREEFQQLCKSVDYFVLQVHALQLPKTVDDPVIVIDPAQARRAVARVAKLNTPFYVALPTYSSFIVFDEQSGKITDVMSEDVDPGQLSPSQRMKLGESSPAEIAVLVREWTDSPPSRDMRGFLWYRLPVATDILNWPSETWEIVMAGSAPKSRIEILVVPQEEGFAKISAKNTGQQPESIFPEIITLVTPANNPILSGDGGRWYQTFSKDSSAKRSISFQLIPTKNDFLPLPIGQSVPIGWIRLESGSGYDQIEIETSLSKGSKSD